MREKGKGARSEAEKTAKKDEKLELLRRRRMAELMKRLQTREAEEGRKAEDPKKILRRIVTDRALKVLKAAESQYPAATCRIEEQLAHLVSKGELEGPILGGQLLWLFRSIGMNVRLETHIRILEHGKLKTIGEKLKESQI
jgi:DNA-binding TFAR19-related protein (PDSD5 family)